MVDAPSRGGKKARGGGIMPALKAVAEAVITTEGVTSQASSVMPRNVIATTGTNLSGDLRAVDCLILLD